MQGCDLHCKGCQNKSTWDINKGKEIDIDDIRIQLEDKIEEIKVELEDLDKEKALKIAKEAIEGGTDGI
jgi:organic radical activating enzyme